MKLKFIAPKDFFYITPASLVLGAWIAFLQPGNWWIGFASFSVIFLLSFVLLKIAYAWSNSGRMLALIIALAFFLRFGSGIALHLALPVYGHEEEDDQAGYVFTDAHTRDDQAWALASSDRLILDAFNQNYSSDQYGGLLAFNAWIYRYLSPDAQRPFLLILFSALFAALGIPFLWKAAVQVFGEKVAWAAAWIFALYPESVLLGAYGMREPYILTFSTWVLWGFVHAGVLESVSRRSAYFWLGLGLLGLFLVSSPAALITIVLLVGWWFFANEKRQISWVAIVAVVALFVLGLVFLSLSLNRSGQFDSSSPLRVINGWLKSTVSLTMYRAEGESGWVQRILGDTYGSGEYQPSWYRLPFITGYGVLQPVLPATLIYPTKTIWKIIGILRATGWYLLLPMLSLSFVAAARQGAGKMRSVILWLSLVVWLWILLSALRAGGDLWDNPRYRTILFVWQALLAGYVWVWWRETRNAWFARVWACELAFVLIFMQWYASRYMQIGFQLPFAVMVGLILGLWGIILGIGWWRDRQRT